MVGLDFHKYYFDIAATGLKSAAPLPGLSTMCSPRVKVIGDAAVCSYTRAVQTVDGEGNPATVFSHETRVWEWVETKWKNVHMHRSGLKETWP